MTAPQIVMVVYVTIVGGCVVVTLHSLGSWALGRLRRRRQRKHFENGLRIMQARVIAQREAVQRRLFGDLNLDEIGAVAKSLSAGLDNLNRRH